MVSFWKSNLTTLKISSLVSHVSTASLYSQKYPLHLQSVHPDFRLHSQLCESETLRQQYTVAGKEPVFISPQDASARGIRHGDVVRVFNVRGQVLAGAVVSDRYAPGVARIH